jgi:sialate O-acetylesterase
MPPSRISYRYLRFCLPVLLIGSSWCCFGTARADVKVPNVFSDHMVLQRDQPNKLWGKAEPGESITAKIAGQSVTAKTDTDGNWSVMLPSLPAGGPHELVVTGKNELRIQDILIGEVWICSGQSNMQWKVAAANDPDLEKLAAKYPKIRMVNYLQKGSQEPVWSHEGKNWMVCAPETVTDFSAVGYFFARQLHQTLDVPIGMINNAWGGSACEAWVDRSVLKRAGGYDELLAKWEETEKKLADMEKVSATANDSNSKKQEEDRNKALQALRQSLAGNQNPGNIYNGVLKSHIGYGIRGAIWYQGESNAGRAYQYRKLFPLMISQWRSEWKQGDFPFYWVQLADFKAETPDANAESDWAELREAQTMTMKALPKTGQAVIVDIGEGKDIHPKNKVDVGRRLARWALANEYGVDIAYRSPEYASMKVEDGKVTLKFEHLGKGWRPFDVAEPQGFAIAGEDKKFVWANAKINPEDMTVSVWSSDVKNPVAVRYAWSNNPVCNMFSTSGLPLTPFRTDDWPGVTISNVK